MDKKMNLRNAGRHKKHDTEELRQFLYNYINEIGGKVTISKLVKYSGVPRYIWDYCKEIKEEIDQLGNPINRMTLISDNSLFDFKSVNIGQIVNEIESKEKLVFVLKKFQLQAEVAFEEGLRYHHLKEENDILQQKLGSEIEHLKIMLEEKEYKYQRLKERNYVLEKENIKLRDSVKGFEKVILEYGIDSTSLLTRKEKGISSNLVEYNPMRDEEENLKKAFPGLFID